MILCEDADLHTSVVSDDLYAAKRRSKCCSIWSNTALSLQALTCTKLDHKLAQDFFQLKAF